MSELPVTFGVLLRNLRNAAGLTQEELAAAARLSVACAAAFVVVPTPDVDIWRFPKS